MIVYEMRNVFNDKKYYGKTKKTLSQRANNHFSDLRKNRHPNRLLSEDFKQFGKDGFCFVELASGLSDVKASALEKHFIFTRKTTDPTNGYNLSVGGDGSKGHAVTKESRKLMSEIKVELYKTHKHPKKGVKMPDHVKAILADANKKRIPLSGEKHPAFGKKNQEHSARMTGRVASEETRKKMSLSRKAFFERARGK